MPEVWAWSRVCDHRSGRVSFGSAAEQFLTGTICHQLAAAQSTLSEAF